MGKGVFGLKEEAALARTVIKKRLAGQPAPDIWFLIILMLLVCYGLVMLFSAGYAVALYRRGDAYTYIRPQLLFAAFGAAAMYAAQTGVANHGGIAGVAGNRAVHAGI